MNGVPSIVGVLFLLSFLGVWVWSIIWAYGDAQSRGKSGWLVALLILLLSWPIGLIAWVVFRPEKKNYLLNGVHITPSLYGEKLRVPLIVSALCSVIGAGFDPVPDLLTTLIMFVCYFVVFLVLNTFICLTWKSRFAVVLCITLAAIIIGARWVIILHWVAVQQQQSGPIL